MERAFGSGKIELLLGDITKVAADAIVTAANSGLKGGGGVDGAVHRAAGPELLKACKQVGGCDTGSAVITEAYDLQNIGVRFVIHAVGPIWRGGNSGEVDLLKNAYAKSLDLADTHDCSSVAFPSISTGVYHFPVAKAAPVAVSTAAKFLENKAGKLEKVIFCLFDQKTFDVFETALRDS